MGVSRRFSISIGEILVFVSVIGLYIIVLSSFVQFLHPLILFLLCQVSTVSTV